jgi:hypothetical protein
MKIRYREAGGFAGLSRGVDIETGALPEEEAQRIDVLVDRAGLRRTRAAGPTEARDLMGYEIVIEDEKGRTSLRFDDASIPPAAEELLAYLQARARPIPLE